MTRRSRYYDYYYPHYETVRARKVDGGMKVKSARGEMAGKWWSKRFISILNSFGWGNRLDRGRRYARSGQVLGITVQKGIVEAQVQGSQVHPYKIRIAFPTISEEGWQSVFSSMKKRPEFLSRMLTGEMPEESEDIFKEAGFSLFPAKAKDVEMNCSCPDYANPCKHIAAVFYVLADNLDEDPFLLLQLKGKSRDEIMKSVLGSGTPGDQRPAPGSGESALSSKDLYGFWKAAAIDVNIRGDDKGHSVSPLKKYPPPVDFNDDIISSMLAKYYEEIRNGVRRLQDGLSSARESRDDIQQEQSS